MSGKVSIAVVVRFEADPDTLRTHTGYEGDDLTEALYEHVRFPIEDGSLSDIARASVSAWVGDGR